MLGLMNGILPFDKNLEVIKMKRRSSELDDRPDKKVRYQTLIDLLVDDRFNEKLFDSMVDDMSVDVNERYVVGIRRTSPIELALKTRNERAVVKLLQRTDLELNGNDLQVTEKNFKCTEIWQMLLSDERFDIGGRFWIYCISETLHKRWQRFRTRLSFKGRGFPWPKRYTSFRVESALSRLLRLVFDSPSFNMDYFCLQFYPPNTAVRNPFLKRLLYMELFKTRGFDGNMIVNDDGMSILELVARTMAEENKYSIREEKRVHSRALATLLTEHDVDVREIPDILTKKCIGSYAALQPVDRIILRLFADEAPGGQQARERSYWNPRSHEVNQLDHNVVGIVDSYLEPSRDADELRWRDRVRRRIADELHLVEMTLGRDLGSIVKSYTLDAKRLVRFVVDAEHE